MGQRAFAGVVTSPTKFTVGRKMTMSKAGDLECFSVKAVDLKVCSPPVDPQLGSTVLFVVKTSDTLVDGRSGEAVCLSTKDLQVVVKYGKSQKQLKADLVSQSKGRNGSIYYCQHSVDVWWYSHCHNNIILRWTE